MIEGLILTALFTVGMMLLARVINNQVSRIRAANKRLENERR